MKTFLNTWDERHALLVGIFELLPPWPPRHPMPDSCKKMLDKEWWYYTGGRTLAVFAWLGVIIGIKEVFW